MKERTLESTEVHHPIQYSWKNDFIISEKVVVGEQNPELDDW